MSACTCSVTTVGKTGNGYVIPGITTNKLYGLFGIDVNSDVLLDINPQSGAASRIGSLSVNFDNGGATWSDTLNGGKGVSMPSTPRPISSIRSIPLAVLPRRSSPSRA